MGRLPRHGLILALVAAAVPTAAAPGPAPGARAGSAASAFSTVGRLVARRVEGRTVVIVPINGPVRTKLSEPFRVRDHWRLYLTIEDARLSIGTTSRAKRPEGVLALTAAEMGADVRITIDVAKLGSYGSRRSEEGVIVWVEDEPPPPPPPVELEAESAAQVPTPAGSTQATAASESGGGWLRSILLVLLAGLVGAGVRHVRRNGVPDWAMELAQQAMTRLRGQSRNGRKPATRPTPLQRNGHVPNIDPRGRSAEIDDAFRVEPETPASGIAALAAHEETNDA